MNVSRQRTRPCGDRHRNEALPAFMERMGGLLERDETSNAERIRQMREAYFADVDALEKSGTLIIPK